MNPVRAVVEGMREIGAHQFRSLLTVSGVVLGVASLMAMFAVVEGMTEGMRAALNRFGGVERVRIDQAEVPPEQEAIKEISPGRTYLDVEALRKIPLLEMVSPEMRINRTVVLTHANRVYSVNEVRGVEKEYLTITEIYRLAEGRFICDLDVERRHRVLVLGDIAREELFGGRREAVAGSQVKVDGVIFTVVGVMERTGIRPRDQQVMMPISSMAEIFLAARVVGGVNQGPDHRLHDIEVRVWDVRHLEAALEQMRTVLHETHRGIQDFGFRTMEDWFDGIERQVQGSRWSGGMVAAVCLLAGGVGITNIMLASIRERTREIGVRRAIGARPADIFVQIFVEVVLLSLLGGALGVLAGYGLVEVVAGILPPERAPIVLWNHAVLSFCAGVLVGMCGGLVPAWKAAGLEPIEALRYE